MWLLEQGFEVFRNQSQHGPVDLMAWDIANDKIIKINVVTRSERTGVGKELFKRYQTVGIEILVVSPLGQVEWLPSIDTPSPITCEECHDQFQSDGRNRNRRQFCSRRCASVNWRRTKAAGKAGDGPPDQSS